jgi:hypothetical protein
MNCYYRCPIGQCNFKTAVACFVCYDPKTILEVLLVEGEEKGMQQELPIEDSTAASDVILLKGREILVPPDEEGGNNCGGRYIVLHSPQKEKEDLESLTSQ